jgi:hypothetical protein
VIGGDNGTFLLSEDGINWKDASVATFHHITAVGYGISTNFPTGLFVAFGTSNYLFGSASVVKFTSVSGTNWMTQPSSPFEELDRKFRGVTFGMGRFVAWVENLIDRGSAISTSGTNWVPMNSLTGPIALGQNLWVNARLFDAKATGVTLLARQALDGFTWSGSGNYAGSSLTAYGLCYGDAGFVAVGDRGYTAASLDGTNWTTTATENDGALRAVTVGAGVYVAVGDAGVIMSSTDGTNWIRRSTGPTRDLMAVAAADDGFIVGGNMGTIAWSSNGVDWATFKAATANTFQAAIKAVGKYVFAGSSGTIMSGETLTNLVLRDSQTSASFSGITYGNGVFVLVGDGGTIATSTNSIDWVLGFSGTTNSLFDIAFGGGQFVSIGDKGTILTSRDALIWIPQNVGTNWRFVDVAYGNGRFVVTAPGFGVLSSSDAVNWQTTTGINPEFAGIGFGNGLFVVRGHFPSATLLVSSDGQEWQQITITNGLIGSTDLAFNNGTFVGVGRFGRISQSQPIVRLTLSFGAVTHISLEGPKGHTYRIEATETPANAVSWTEAITLFEPPYTWDEAGVPLKRFYRAMLLP